MLVKPTVKRAKDSHIRFALTFLSHKVNRAIIYWGVCAQYSDYVQCSTWWFGFECVVILPQPSSIRFTAYFERTP